jgi:hypothetical protein
MHSPTANAGQSTVENRGIRFVSFHESTRVCRRGNIPPTMGATRLILTRPESLVKDRSPDDSQRTWTAVPASSRSTIRIPVSYAACRQIVAALKLPYTVTLARPWELERIPFPGHRHPGFLPKSFGRISSCSCSLLCDA